MRLIATTCLALLLALPAWAADIDLSGTWALDKAASDSVDELLKAQGASFLERKVAGGMDVTQVITHTDDSLTIEIQTSKKTQQQELTVDGAPREVEGDNGKATVTHVWDGATLVTSSQATDKTGAAVKTRVVRSLEDDGKTMRQHIELTAADGVTYAVDRVFRKQ